MSDHSTEFAKRLRIYNAYRSFMREGAKETKANISKICNEAGLNRSFFYDSFETVDNIPVIAANDLIKITSERICACESDSTDACVAAIVKTAAEYDDMRYIATHSFGCSCYQQYIKDTVNTLTAQGMANPRNGLKYMIFEMKAIYLFYLITNIEHFDISERTISNLSKLMELSYRRPRGKRKNIEN